MNSKSVENIKCLYGWLEDNPNNFMHPNGYSVIEFKCNDGGPDEGFDIKERIFQTKEEAWLHFEKEMYSCYDRGWWDSVDWTDDIVVTSFHDGCSLNGEWADIWIEKWDGFDNDIEFSWKYNDIKYKSLKDLWEAVPIFQGKYMVTDHPCIWNYVEETDTYFRADLNIELSESFKKSCDKWIEEKKKAQEEAKEAEERRKKEYEEEINNLTNCTDLPF